MPKYHVVFNHIQYSRAEVEITARSLKAAQKKAEAMSASDVDTEPYDGEFYVESVGRKPR